MRARIVFLMALGAIGSVVSPSEAWIRGGWGFHGGHARVFIGGPWWPYSYGPYYPPYDPYYYDSYPPAYGVPYAYPVPVERSSVSQGQAPSSAPSDTSRHDLRKVNDHLRRMRDQLDYKYQDGDMSRTERDMALHYLDEIEKMARSEADPNNGYLTGDQEDALLRQIQQADPAVHRDPAAPYPPVESYSASKPSEAVQERLSGNPARRDSRAVNDLLLELRTLLNQKLKEGAITQAQSHAEVSYLQGIEQEAHSLADVNGGALPADQEEKFVQDLHRAYYAINHDLVVH